MTLPPCDRPGAYFLLQCSCIFLAQNSDFLAFFVRSGSYNFLTFKEKAKSAEPFAESFLLNQDITDLLKPIKPRCTSDEYTLKLFWQRWWSPLPFRCTLSALCLHQAPNLIQFDEFSNFFNNIDAIRATISPHSWPRHYYSPLSFNPFFPSSYPRRSRVFRKIFSPLEPFLSRLIFTLLHTVLHHLVNLLFPSSLPGLS